LVSLSSSPIISPKLVHFWLEALLDSSKLTRGKADVK
jgi:hypothetical protein